MPIFPVIRCVKFFAPDNIKYISRCITHRIAEEMKELASTESFSIGGKLYTSVIVPEEDIVRIMTIIFDERTNPLSMEAMNEAVICNIVRQFISHVMTEARTEQWLDRVYDPSRGLYCNGITDRDKPNVRGPKVGRDTSKPCVMAVTY